VVDFVRDPQMNPSMVTSKRLVVHPSDFAEFDKRLKPEYIVEFRLADGVEASAFVKAFESSGLSSQGITVDTSIFKLMNGLTTVPVAAVALLVAILLAVVAALVLRYAFLAAMEEDLAQISVLKAIGAPPRGVKRLYLAKYSALTAGGALVGYLLSIPMAAQLSDAVLLYLGKSSAGAWPILCSIAAAVALAASMVGFCWILLRRIDRLSAVQALRTGVSGRVRRRRHRLSLASSRRLPVDVWLGLREAFRPANALLLAVLTVCTIVLILPANVVTTMGDPGFASYMGIGRADLRIDVPAGSADLDTAYSKVAAEAGVGRAVQMTDHRYDMRKPGGAWGSALVESGDQSAFSGRYLRGRAPATAKEIALSSNQADEAKVGLGDVVDVSPQPIIDLLDQGRIPVISSVAPLTTDSETVLNVNADTAAAAIAVALKARTLLTLTDVEGLYAAWPDRSSLVPFISAAALEELLPTLESGMIPKMEACLRAVHGGVGQAHVVDGRQAHSMLLEIVTDQGVGTVIHPGDAPIPPLNGGKSL